MLFKPNSKTEGFAMDYQKNKINTTTILWMNQRYTKDFDITNVMRTNKFLFLLSLPSLFHNCLLS